MWRRPKNKYGAVRTNGRASKLEAAVENLLLIMERAGAIRELRKQVPVEVVVKIITKMDFSAVDPITGETFYIEAKGFEDTRFKFIKRGWKQGGGKGLLQIWGGTYRDPKIIEEIKS